MAPRTLSQRIFGSWRGVTMQQTMEAIVTRRIVSTLGMSLDDYPVGSGVASGGQIILLPELTGSSSIIFIGQTQSQPGAHPGAEFRFPHTATARSCGCALAQACR